MKINTASTPSHTARVDVSIVVCVHNEGRLFHHTLKSIQRAIDFANRHGIRTELIIVADSIDSATRHYFKNCGNILDNINHLFEEVSYRDLGSSRNHGVMRAHAPILTVIDGDDLMCENWIVSGLKTIKNSRTPVVVHPEYAFFFGARDLLWKMYPSPSSHYSHRNSVEINYYCAHMMTATSILKETPYKRTSVSESFGFEDWLWNSDTLFAGVEHTIVPSTMYAYRVKSQGSLFAKWQNCLIPKTPYFLPKSLGKDSDPNHLDVANIGHIGIKSKSLANIRSIVNYLFNRLIKPISRRIHPRLEEYSSKMQYETLHLFRPVDNKKRNKMPEWLLDEIRSLHEIDYRVFMSEHLQDVIEIYNPQPTAFTDAYWELATEIPQNTDYLILIPFMKNGGAEKLVSNYCKAILNLDSAKKIIIATTSDDTSPYSAQLDKRISLVKPGPSFFLLDDNEQARLISLLTVQLTPKKLLLINSIPGYMAVERFGKAISKNTKIFVSIFSIDRTTEGRNTHVFIDRMQDAIDNVEQVFTDNVAITRRLTEHMAVDADKFSVLYQPVDFTKLIKTSTKEFENRPLRILWAGRIDREKRPDNLIKIATKAKKEGLPLEFHVYGSPAFEDHSYIHNIEESEAVIYHGPFEGGLGTLPLKEFDVFLLTSEWEGMPNVILEAICGGLIVVASDVGGIHELIINRKTGYLVSPFDNINGYVEAFKQIIQSPKESREISKAVQQLILERHSMDRFLQSIKKHKSFIN